MLRIFASFVLLLSVLFMPFWLSCILALLGIIIFSFFWEAAFLFLISDLIFGVKEGRLFYTLFISFSISVLIILLLEFLKKKLKFYPK